MSDELKRARMALAQTVTRSLADSYSDERAARVHRSAAVTYLRRGGREDLAVRLDLDRDVRASETRRVCRELMQKIDAELEPSVAGSPFRAASDGGDR
jgi:hypothetical protein